MANYISFKKLKLQNYVDVLPTSNTYKKLNDNSILTNCVAHDDNNPSMCLTQKRDRVYFHCFSGCDQRDVAKAFAAGADAVMIGSLFAGTDEAPGKLIRRNGKLFKNFRGMGSVGAMNKGSADRYFQSKQKDTSKYVPEGVEGFAKYKGKVGKIIYKLIGGLKSSMGYLGSKQIKHLRNKPEFVKITKAGFYESMVHNVDIVKDENKY